MVSTEYMVSYSQVLEILKYISKDDYNRIPKNLIELFKNNCSKESDFKYDPEKTLAEQNVTDTTKTIIAMLFRDYWATDIQKNKILNYQQQERLKQNNVNDVFKKPENINQPVNQTVVNEPIRQETVDNNLPTVIQKENVFTKIKNFFSKMFHK